MLMRLYPITAFFFFFCSSCDDYNKKSELCYFMCNVIYCVKQSMNHLYIKINMAILIYMWSSYVAYISAFL